MLPDAAGFLQSWSACLRGSRPPHPAHIHSAASPTRKTAACPESHPPADSHKEQSSPAAAWHTHKPPPAPATPPSASKTSADSARPPRQELRREIPTPAPAETEDPPPVPRCCANKLARSARPAVCAPLRGRGVAEWLCL